VRKRHVNAAIREVVVNLNARIMRKLGVSRAELLKTVERPTLKARCPDALERARRRKSPSPALWRGYHAEYALAGHSATTANTGLAPSLGHAHHGVGIRRVVRAMDIARTTASVGVVAAVIALCGCAQGPSAYETKIVEIAARHHELEAHRAREAERERKIANAEAERRQSEKRMIANMREPLGKFLSETPPRSCSSPHLLDAASGPPALLAQRRRGSAIDDMAFMQRLGATMLEVGDAARQAGCSAVARRAYDDVIRTFGGPDYRDLQMRAKIAIRDIGPQLAGTE
jgi:hypothetical protein